MAIRRILITGCSGAGKTSLAEAMARRGHEIIKEPGRRVIRAEERMGGKGVPWLDAERFCKLCLRIATADWEGVRAGTALFDRGVLDASLHLARLGQPEVANGYLRTFPYDPVLILAPPWKALFQTDADRRQSYDDAVSEYIDIAAGLEALGYKPRVLPEAPISDRADWLEEQLTPG